MINSPEVKKLINLIKDSFRVRPNQNPVYIDFSDNLERLKAKQHQVIFGRRGSGKSCLLVYFKNSISDKNSLEVYIEADEIKRLGYPDILTRLLLSIMEKIVASRNFWQKIIYANSKLNKSIKTLRKILDQAENRQVKQEENKSTNYTAKAEKGILSGAFGKTNSLGKLSEFQESKLDTLERYLSDYKKALQEEIKKRNLQTIYILLDDFYLIKKERQPDVIDYLHRLVRGTEMYLKVGTVKHRTTLVRNDGQTIGVVLNQDIEPINLDRTLEDLTAPTQFLSSLLNSLGSKVGLSNPSTDLFNPHALEKLVIASGGVPRDFLTILVDAIENAISQNKNHITPTNVWKSASSFSYQNKLKDLRVDVGADAKLIEKVFRDILKFCINDKKRTSFLIAQEEAQSEVDLHELILQLMDGKLLHIIEPDTSAASNRPGRYEAYTLDFSLFMEPRKRGIQIVEFWNFDNDGRRTGVRESPIYSLENAKKAITNDDDDVATETLINNFENEQTNL
ncbi:hypothetical protein [uncultured Chryseobacterium sp.]|uniref:hypothetical protein n=1 Tax=uncultured Chryseobacterium sp. TaxID=259322 RepID=UPI0025F3111C|nr:hypothetical protein [uncultured Chryseobacterium sp.]